MANYFYTASGYITREVQTNNLELLSLQPLQDAEVGYISSVQALSNPDDYWYDTANSSVEPRANAQNIGSVEYITADGAAHEVLNNLPDPCYVCINGKEELLVEGGTFNYATTAERDIRIELRGKWKADAWVIKTRSLQTRRDEMWAQVKELRDQHEWAGISIQGLGMLDTDPTSQRKILLAAFKASINPNFTINFTLADNTSITLNAVQVITAAELVTTLADAVHQKSLILRQAIYDEQVTTLAQLEAIDIVSDWPGI